MEKDLTINLENLSSGYRVKGNDKVISQHLTAELTVGEMTCLLGPNGAGKSTLLRTLSAFQPALSGQILIDQRSVDSYNAKDLSKLLSVVLTDNTNIKNLTVTEVVAIGRSPYTGFWGKLNEKDKKTIEKCLQWVGITELQDRKMETLSDGEKQKVMIAKAIAQETPIIFLDEPTAYLDYPSKVSMMMLLHRLAHSLKKIIFLSTHDLEHALQIADKIWLLDSEHGLTTGIPEDLCLGGKIEEYFTRPGMTFNRESCTFSIQHEVARKIVFQGNPSSISYQLAAKAFLRHAIQPIRSIEEAQFESTRPDIIVSIPKEGCYRLIENGKEVLQVEKIEHILPVTNSYIVKNQIEALRDAANMTPFD